MAGLTYGVHGSIREISEAEWDALAAHEPDMASPFVRHAFLAAAEESGSASPRAGAIAADDRASRRQPVYTRAPLYRRSPPCLS